MNNYLKNKVSLAPMVDRTDNNFREFIRFLSKNILLYTEMITDKAIINNADKVLKINGNQNPLVLQIATNNKFEAREAVKISNKYNYDEININLGCPSDRISHHNMGAFLMSEVDLVVDIINEMKKETDKPITVKHRIGIDGKGVLKDDKRYFGYDFLSEFVYKINKTGVNKYIIHAREAILKGLSPKENRTIPELDYNMVYKLKKEFNNLFIEINGGIKTVNDIKEHLKYVDAVMIGRALYDNPLLALEIEKEIFNEIPKTKKEIFDEILFKIENKNEKEIHRYLMHLHGLFLGKDGSKLWKNICSNTKTNYNDVKIFLDRINYE